MKLFKPELAKEDVLKAIKDGVKEAILEMTESGDGYTGEIIRGPFLEAIEQGVKQAVAEMLVDSNT